MKPSFFVCLFLIFTITGFSQSDSSAIALTSVGQLTFMEGEWEGTGWILGRDRKKKLFSQSETIQSKVDGQALMVDGLGYAIDSTGAITDRVIHNAFGLISYNPEREAVTMISFSEMQGRMENELEFISEKHLRWSFKNDRSGGIIRFTEDFSEEGIWKEVGEISMDNKNWFQFFEMSLNKK